MRQEQKIETFTNERLKSGLRKLPFVLLGAGFLAFGLYLRSQIPWDDRFELHGLDYGIYGYKFAHFHWIGEMSFRHPFFPLITAPVTLFAHRFHLLGTWPYWTFLLTVFSAAMAASTALVHSVLRASGAGRGPAMAGTALFASFAYTWILAACPESFAFACLGLLLTLRWGVSGASADNPRDRWMWLALAVLNGGITLTHGPKVALAYLASRGFTAKRLIRVLLIISSVVAMFLLAMFVRYLIFNLTHAESKVNFSDGLVRSCLSFTDNADLPARLKLIAGFFAEPIATHGDTWSVNHLERPYNDWLVPIVVVALYAAAIVGAIGKRHTPLVKMVLAMFSVDFVLHIVCFWGMAEGHIYCGHWLFAPALLAAQLPASLTNRRLRLASLALLFILAAVIFAANAKVLY